MWTVDAKPGAKKADGSDYTPTDLREIQDWVIKPQLRNVPGVVEVNSIGGFEKQYHVTPDPRKLVAYGLSFHDVMEALAKNNANVGAGYIERNGEQYLIRAPGQVRDAGGDSRHRRREPQRVAGSHRRCRRGRSWAANCAAAPALHNGHECVLGTTFMLMGENSRTVSHAGPRADERDRSHPARGRGGEDGLQPH